MMWTGNFLGFPGLGPLPLLCWGSRAEKGEQVPVHNGWQPDKARAGRS
jgi:hypothetical protein